MTEKYTKGPWGVPHFACDDVDCNCVYVLAEYGGMGSIAEVSICKEMQGSWGDDIGPSVHEARANAHLIAAAPDMFEALEAIVAHFETNGDPENGPADAMYEALLIGPARAALAKARGEQ